jgi:RNA polymerase-interacting CarD/CdnL/TRCF family regulator
MMPQFPQEITKRREKRVKSEEANECILQDVVTLQKYLAHKVTKKFHLIAEKPSLEQANQVQKEEIARLQNQQEQFWQPIGNLKMQGCKNA